MTKSLNSLNGFRRLRCPLVLFLIVLALFTVSGFWIVPAIVRHYLPIKLGEYIGRDISLEGLRFNPFTQTVELTGVRIMAAQGTADASKPAASFDRLLVDLELKSLVKRGLVIREIALESPTIKLTRISEGQHNWSDVLAKFSKDKDDDEPMRYSVANIHIEKGNIEFTDHVTHSGHQLTELHLGIPVISNLAVDADVFIQPKLAARLDNKPVRAIGSLTFKQNGFTAVLDQISTREFDIPAWWVYVPAQPSFKIPSATLALNLRVTFEQFDGKTPETALRGSAVLNKVVIQDAFGQTVLSVDEIEAELADIDPFANRYHISKLRLESPEVNLVRLAKGGFNVERLFKDNADGKISAKTAKAPEKKGATTNFVLSSARIRGGRLNFTDQFVPGGFQTSIKDITLDLTGLNTANSTHKSAPADITLSYESANGEKFTHHDQLHLTPLDYAGEISLEGIQPALYRNYYASTLPTATLRRGRIDGTLRIKVADQAESDAPLIEIATDALTLSELGLSMVGKRDEFLTLQSATLTDSIILPGAQSVTIGALSLAGVKLKMERAHTRHIDLEALATKPSSATRRGAANSAPWTLDLKHGEIRDGSIDFKDLSASTPTTIFARNISLLFTDLQSKRNGVKTALSLSGNIHSSVDRRTTETGRIRVSGTLAALAAMHADLKIGLESVGLEGIQPYIREQAQISVNRGRLTANGKLVLRQQHDKILGSWHGNLLVKDFHSRDEINKTDFVRWNEVALKSAKLQINPLSIEISEIGVNGFNSRLILDEQGCLNLREIQRSSAELREAHRTCIADTTPSETPQASAAGSDPAASPAAKVHIGRIAFRNSTIAYNDRFIQPNYNALLGDLKGELKNLSSDQESLASLKLEGTVGHSAPLSISGEFNPFRQDKALDIAADVKDFELTDLSGYSGRYVGYGISKGKLSATVEYQIKNRKLAATNHVVLDQLSFGDKVESKEATKLPVRLAVTLLKNSRGEIEINMPVSGTIDDPQFSVFGLVARAFVNLIGKAITSPFALLGREELAELDFEPGSFRLTAQQEEKLQELVKALEERPSLKLDIIGRASKERDMPGIRLNKLHREIIRLYRAQTRSEGGKRPAKRDITDLPADQYADLLEELYRNTPSSRTFQKPKILFIEKKLPVAEMEKLLTTSYLISDDDVAALARRREGIVSRWLTETGKIPADRIYQRTLTAKELAKGAGNAKGVQFSLR